MSESGEFNDAESVKPAEMLAEVYADCGAVFTQVEQLLTVNNKSFLQDPIHSIRIARLLGDFQVYLDPEEDGKTIQLEFFPEGDQEEAHRLPFVASYRIELDGDPEIAAPNPAGIGDGLAMRQYYLGLDAQQKLVVQKVIAIPMLRDEPNVEEGSFQHREMKEHDYRVLQATMRLAKERLELLTN